MKTEKEIKKRVQEILDQEWKSRAEAFSQKAPVNCKHNHRQPLDSRGKVGGVPNPGYNRVNRVGLPVVQSIGLCMLGSENPVIWNGTICDTTLDAQRCPDFSGAHTPEQVLETFNSEMHNPEWVKTNLPELAALLWVLEVQQTLKPTWWKALYYKVVRLLSKSKKPAPELPIRSLEDAS